jgi:hypothetical protein
MRRSVAGVLCLLWLLQPASAASVGGQGDFIHDVIIPADWQYPLQLPSRFRNHCSYENFTWRPYCSNHCGNDYQFYHCSTVSFGCCHLGRGYCDWNGFLRCHP